MRSTYKTILFLLMFVVVLSAIILLILSYKKNLFSEDEFIFFSVPFIMLSSCGLAVILKSVLEENKKNKQLRELDEKVDVNLKEGRSRKDNGQIDENDVDEKTSNKGDDSRKAGANTENQGENAVPGNDSSEPIGKSEVDKGIYNIAITIKDVQKAFLQTEERLLSESKRIGRAANMSLIAGIVIAFLGLSLLYTLFFIVPEKDANQINLFTIISKILPRFTLVIILEYFSFFFLKLYRESHDRIKYYHNELSNIESKKIAILVCLSIENEGDNKMNIIKSLIDVERNFVLKKDESTIEIERAKIDANSKNDIISLLKEIIPTLKKQ